MDFLFWLRSEQKVEDQLGQMEVEWLLPDFSKFDHDPQQLFQPKVMFYYRGHSEMLQSTWESWSRFSHKKPYEKLLSQMPFEGFQIGCCTCLAG